jgi:hypothetical protein
MKKILRTILIVVGVASWLCIIGVLAYGYYAYNSLTTKTNPSAYAGVVAERLEWSDEFKFLPRTIPKDAVKVAFFYDPGPLQAATVIALRLTLPPERVRDLLKELEASGRTECMPTEDGEHWIRCRYPLFDDEKQSSKGVRVRVRHRLPRSYRVFLLVTERASWFTAVSIDTNEVFYYVSYG